MKPNKLTPGANIMWESSRMIIPQHKEAAIRQARESLKRDRPELTEEELQEMFGRLSASKANTLEVTIIVYGEFENRQLRGIVTGLDPRQRLIKIEHNYDWDLIEFENVLSVQLDDFYFKEEH
ncbi:YolD-like family protein [Paenibacillus sp. TAB 01]|uniref:YolD-like family protein n=1 Tax=Paenibacillus sp. TAB 01 TaxID=3368988 RepID=UPI0037510682